MEKKTVLFLCVHNSARSQMAEALLNHVCPGHFAAESAGLSPGKLNPVVVRALAEVGLDIADRTTRDAFSLVQQGRAFDYVITVCSEADAAGCPVFPGRATRLHWPFPDPSGFTGTEDERLARTREVRDAIRRKVDAFCETLCPAGSLAATA